MDIKIPELGESIQEVQIAHWLKKEGDWVNDGEDLVELETEKASQALPSPASGLLTKVLYENGQFVKVGEVIAQIDENAKRTKKESDGSEKRADPAPPPIPAPSPKPQVDPAAEQSVAKKEQPRAAKSPESKSKPAPGSAPPKDTARQPSSEGTLKKSVELPEAQSSAPSSSRPVADSERSTDRPAESRQETVTPMSMIRRTIANRLVEAQHNAALLTTFNEIDMQPVLDLRKKYQEAFQAKHGVKLGFMSFFAKASVEGLRRFPNVNSEIRGTDVVSRNYFDIGIAIGGGKGLVVPVLRDVHRMSFAEIEREIGRFAELALANKLKPSDLEGGTFTISNGGVYGSLLSTPIVNPPQSGILGLHAIQQRPIALDGQIVIRPMMYIALTYDHRIIDGREAVSFLKTIKEVLEEPARLFLEV